MYPSMWKCFLSISNRSSFLALLSFLGSTAAVMSGCGDDSASGGGCVYEACGDGETGDPINGAWAPMEDDWSNAGDLETVVDEGITFLVRKSGYGASPCEDDTDCSHPASFCRFDGIGNSCGDIRPHHDYLTAVHTIHMPTGEFLMFHGEHEERVWTIGESGPSMRWHPIPYEVAWEGCSEGGCIDFFGYPDVFCAGHSLLPTGEVLLAGGNVTGAGSGGGLTSIFSFDPRSADPDILPYGWTHRDQDELEIDRWYPTLTPLPDGKILISGGESRVPGGRNTFEIYDPVAEVVEILPLTFEWGDMPLYPFMFVLPNGDILYAGGEEAAPAAYDGRIIIPGPTAADWVWADVVIDSTTNGGSAVMYEPGKLMKSGGILTYQEAVSVTEILDLSCVGSGGYPQNMAWIPTEPMNERRHFHTLTLLPTGQVLATGGNTRANGVPGEDSGNPCEFEGQVIKEIPCLADSDCPTQACTEATNTCDPLNNACFATRSAEVWEPECHTWRLLEEQRRPRMYHSTAALLPDGRVMSTGGGHRSAVAEQPYTEYFEPEYGDGSVPSVLLVDDDIGNDEDDAVYLPYEGTIDMFALNFEALDIQAVKLVKLASVTHQFDQGQLYVPLEFEGGPVMYTVAGPRSSGPHDAAAIAPPGYYMLFAETGSGEISVGQYVRVGHQSNTSWQCNLIKNIAPHETSCLGTPIDGRCPAPLISHEPIPPPLINTSIVGWTVVAPAGLIEDPSSPTDAEMAAIEARCVRACEQEWASFPEVSADCTMKDAFALPTLVEQRVVGAVDLIAPDGSLEECVGEVRLGKLAKPVIEGRPRGFEGTKPVARTRDHFELVVHPLDGARGDGPSSPKPVEDQGLMATEHASDLLDGFETRAHRLEGPVLDEGLCILGGRQLPQLIELLFEQVGTDRAEVVAKQVSELDELPVGQVLWPLEQAPAPIPEQRLVAIGLELPDLLGADLVDGLVHLGDDVIAVEHVDGMLGASSEDLEVGLPHVAGDVLKPSRTRAKHVEEGIESRLGTTLADPQQTLAVLVDLVDDGEVVLAPTSRHLVDADGADAGQVTVLETPLDGELD